jgi:hypothetical protein
MIHNFKTESKDFMPNPQYKWERVVPGLVAGEAKSDQLGMLYTTFHIHIHKINGFFFSLLLPLFFLLVNQYIWLKRRFSTPILAPLRLTKLKENTDSTLYLPSYTEDQEDEELEISHV